jgi:hypothetical protein
MKSLLINPFDLPLTPPMDLNEISAPTEVSAFPMQLRVRKGVGLFGAVRDVTNGLIRPHNAIDLLAPKGTKVFASVDGQAIIVDNNSILIQHDFGVNFLTYYEHVQNILIANREIVTCGQHIAEVAESVPNECHLHFEVRYPFDNINPSRTNSLPINPTFALYYWEIRTFQNDDPKSRKVIDNVNIVSIEEIVIGKQLRFLMCKVEGNNRELFLPVQTGLHEDDVLAETIRMSFFSGKKNRIVWRESLFFSKIQKTYDKASIIADIKVYR